MAGVRVDIEIDDKRAHASIGRLLDALADPRPALDEIGARLVASTLERFRSESAPDGTPWQQSLRALVQGGQTLQDTGRLRDSIQHVVRGDGVDIGSNLVYAAIHQFGGKAPDRGPGQAGKGHAVTLPARPYLGIDGPRPGPRSGSDAAAIERIVTRHIAEAVT